MALSRCLLLFVDGFDCAAGLRTFCLAVVDSNISTRSLMRSKRYVCYIFVWTKVFY